MSESASARIQRWREDPVSFVRDCFGVEPDPWQKDALMAFPTKQRHAYKACKGPGKTTTEAWLAWNFLATRPYPKIAATSISGDNLADGLWAEMAKWQQKSPFLMAAFEWTKTRIFAKDHPETWFMTARTWSKSADQTQQANTLAGLHADYILFLLDEVGGIPDSVMAAAEAALATGIECKIVIGGNPTHLDGPLYRACTNERHLWHIIEVTGDPDDPQRSPRISVQWAREQIEKYGRDNPWVLVNVFGKFPPSSINALLGPDEVHAAMKRHLDPSQYNFQQMRLGVDVARFGDDRTVIFRRQGLASFQPTVLRQQDTVAIAGRVMYEINEYGSEMELIDDTGHWGHGVIDNLRAAGRNPFGIQYHAGANDKRFKNRRVEMWLNMADWVKRGGVLPPVPELVGELTTPTYTFVNGVFMLEDKDAVKIKLGRSPDLADALGLTFAMPDMPTSMGGLLPQRHAKARTEYDPVERMSA